VEFHSLTGFNVLVQILTANGLQVPFCIIVPNFLTIGQAVAQIEHFSTISYGRHRRHFDSSNILTVDQLLRANMLNHAKFHQN